MSHSSLLPTKGVDFVVGFNSKQKSSIIFIDLDLIFYSLPSNVEPVESLQYFPYSLTCFTTPVSELVQPQIHAFYWSRTLLGGGGLFVQQLGS